MNAITWVAQKTKQLQRADKNRKPYKTYNTKAWALWRKQPKKSKKKVGTIAYTGGGKGGTATGNNYGPPATVYKGKIEKTPGQRFPGKRVSGLHRVTGRKTSVTYNTPVRESGQFGSVAGTVSSHKAAIRAILNKKIGETYVRSLRATTKTERRKFNKELGHLKKHLRENS